MLKRIVNSPNPDGVITEIKNAAFPSPFSGGLEYSAPARGCWNIVHTGMLIPQAHQIFVCAAGCLRGVVLTAAEMNATERFSTICIKENDVLDGTMEQIIIDGVGHILQELPKMPPAVLLYTSCIHHFLGCDMPLVFKKLRENHPDCDFTDCYMNPIMRRSGLTPDALMRRQLYSLLKPTKTDKSRINIIGNDLATDKNSELFDILEKNGFSTTEITDCKSYAEYLKMAESAANICFFPSAKAAGKALEKRLGQKNIYINPSFNFEEIEAQYELLKTELSIELPDFSKHKNRCKAALCHAKEQIGNAPVAVDYTAFSKPLSLCRMLLENGFNLTEIYADSLNADEKADFEIIKMLKPDLKICSTVHPKMRFIKNEHTEKTLAIGQKAAYFTKTQYFVNVVENAGLFGFYAIEKLAELMEAAFETKKDTESTIQIKGLGCDSCI